MQKYNYKFAINDSYKNGFGFQNNDSVQNKTIRNYPDTQNINDVVFYTSNQTPTNINLLSVNKQIEHIDSLFESGKTNTLYTFDLETLGSLLPNANDLERKIGTISEFAINAVDVSLIDGKHTYSNPRTITNATFGLTKAQQSAANELLGKYQSMLKKDALTAGEVLTGAENSTLEFLAMYGGEFKTGKSTDFFGFENGIYTIKKHATPKNKLDIEYIKKGIFNMTEIGKNQGIHSNNPIVNKVFDTLNTISSNEGVVMGYNSDIFDVNFLKGFVDKYDGLNYVDTSGIKFVDARKILQAAHGESYIKELTTVANLLGIDVPTREYGTLGANAKARGVNIDAHIGASDALATGEMMFVDLGNGQTVYSRAKEQISNKMNGKTDLFAKSSQSDNIVFKARKASFIDSNNAVGYGANGGMYDQYLEGGEVVDYMSYSVNSDNYYKIGWYKVIDKDSLEIAANKKFTWSTDSKKAYVLSLDNASNIKDTSAIIVRESHDAMQEFINRHMDIKYIIDHEKDLQHAYNITQGMIDIDTQRKVEANAMRKFNSMRSSKEDGFALASKMVNAYDSINNGYSNATGGNNLSIQQLNGILNGELSIDGYSSDDINKVLDDVFGKSESNKKAFLYGYQRIQDDVDVNRAVINEINKAGVSFSSSIKNEKRKDLATNYYKTMMYDHVMSGIEKEATNYRASLLSLGDANMSESDMSNILDVAKNEILGMKSIPTEFVENDAVDILRPMGWGEKASDFYKKSSADRYTRANGYNYKSISNAINKQTMSIGKNIISNPSENEIFNARKKYLKSLAKDFKKRKVFSNSQYKEMVGYINNTTDNSLYHIFELFGSNVTGVINNAESTFTYNELANRSFNSNNGITKSFKGLLVNDIRAIDNKGHKVGKDTYSNFVNKTFGDNLTPKINEYIDSFKSFNNVGLIDYDYENTFKGNNALTDWFKGYGYSDDNIKFLEDVLYRGNNPIGRTTFKDGASMGIHFFEMQDKRGNPMPAVGFSKNTAKLDFSNGMPDNFSYMILPRMDTDKTLYSVESNKTVPSVVKIGDVQKHNMKKLSINHEYDSNGIISKSYVNLNDTINESLSSIRINKNNVVSAIEKGSYQLGTMKLNGYSKSKQLNETGVSQNIARYKPDGSLYYEHVPRLVDIDNANTMFADDIIKILPNMYRDNEKVKESLSSAFGSRVDILSKEMNKLDGRIRSNKAITIADLSPELQEWIYGNMTTRTNLIERAGEYFYKNNNKMGEEVFRNILNNKGMHTLIKDSNADKIRVMFGPGIMSNPFAHTTNIARPVMNQSRNIVPILLNELNIPSIQQKVMSYTNIKSNNAINPINIYEQNYGMRFGQRISTEDIMNQYINPMSKDYNLTTGITGNVKQMRTRDALIAYEEIRKDSSFLDNINKTYGTNYSQVELDKVLNKYIAKTSFHEQGGIYNPALKPVLNKPEIYSMEVGSDMFNSLSSGSVIEDNTFLGVNTKGKKLSYNGVPIEVVGKEEFGFDFDDYSKSTKEYKIHYKFKNPTNDNMIKASSFGWNEKGTFNTIDMGEEYRALVGEVYNKVYGKSTIAVSNYELNKHQSGGGVLMSYVNTMLEEAEKYDIENNAKEYDALVSKLQKQLPTWGFDSTVDPNTGNRILTHKSNPINTTVSNNPIQAIKNIIKEYENDGSQIGKNITQSLDYMEKNNLFKTEFSIMQMTDSYADSVKVNERMLQQYNILQDVDVTKATAMQVRMAMESNSSYQDADRMLQNIYSYIGESTGNSVGVIEDLNINDIILPGSTPTFEDIKNSKIFDFDRTNEYGAKVNAFRINLPEGTSYINPISKVEETSILIPLMKSYHMEGEVMLSKTQMAIENLIISINELENTDSNIRDISKVQDNAEKMVKAMTKEITHKDGIKNKQMKTVKLEHGGMDLVTKIVSPEVIKDDTGGIIGLLDKSSVGLYNKLENGQTAFYDVLKVSQQALEEKGVDFELIGKQLLEEGVETKGHSLINAKKDLAEAKSILDDKRVREIYKEEGLRYFEEVGVFGSGGRHPVIYEESYATMKIMLDRNLDGRSVVAPAYTMAKLHGDADGDWLFYNLLGRSKDGKFRLIGDDALSYKYAQRAFEKTGIRNISVLKELVEDYESGFKKGSFYSNSDRYNKRIIDVYEQYLLGTRPDAKEFMENLNYFRDDFSMTLAMKSRTSKAGIGYVSNINNALRDVAINFYDHNSEELSDILALTDLEQKIISTKHITDIDQANKLTPISLYSGAFDALPNIDTAYSNKWFDDVVESLNEVKYFGDDMITVDDILDINGKYSVDNAPSSVKRVRTLYEMLQVQENRDILNNKYKEDILTMFDESSVIGNTEHFNNERKIMTNAKNLEYITSGDKKIGVGASLEHTSGSYQPLSIKSLKKNATLGISIAELEDMNSGEVLPIIGRTYEDISSQIKELGLSYTDKPNIIRNTDNTTSLDRMFMSYDDYIRENILEDLIGENKKGNINQSIVEKLSKYNANEEQVQGIAERVKSLTLKERNEYKRNFKAKNEVSNKEITFETEKLINELRLTNTLEEADVMNVAKKFRNDIASDMIDDMNNSVLLRASVERRRREAYSNNIPGKFYTNLDQYMKNYQRRGEGNTLAFGGKTSLSSSSVASFISRSDLNNLEFEKLLDIDMKFTDGSSLKLGSLNIVDDITKIALGESRQGAIATKESIQNAQYFLNKLDMSMGEHFSKTVEMSIGNIQKSMASAIRESSKEVAKKTSILNKSVDYVKNNKTKSLVMVGAALGLASAVTKIANHNSVLVPESTSKEESAREQYMSRDDIKPIAPKSHKTVVLQPNSTKGVTYKVSSKNRGSSDNESLLSNLRGLMGGAVNLRYKEERDDREVNESWIKEKISNLI